jgi:hypothetical protein
MLWVHRMCVLQGSCNASALCEWSVSDLGTGTCAVVGDPTFPPHVEDGGLVWSVQVPLAVRHAGGGCGSRPVMEAGCITVLPRTTSTLSLIS